MHTPLVPDLRLHPSTNARDELIARLWSEAERALLLSDLYLVARPDLHDRAIAQGTALAAHATRLQSSPLEPPGPAAEALTDAERALSSLAPRA